MVLKTLFITYIALYVSNIIYVYEMVVVIFTTYNIFNFLNIKPTKGKKNINV